MRVVGGLLVEIDWWYCIFGLGCSLRVGLYWFLFDREWFFGKYGIIVIDIEINRFID